MPLRVAIVGCGDIATVYMLLSRQFTNFEIVACASRRLESAQDFARRHDIIALPLDDVLTGRGGIEAILNLTPPTAHFEISMAAIQSGLHVYTEKPLATDVEEGNALLARAHAQGVRLGAAPDTFLGGALQTALELLDSGAIGAPIFGQATFISHGMEDRHPNPAFFFKPGGGPVFDIGPYYVTALVALLGPVQAVSAVGRIGRPERVVTTPGSPHRGETITVEVPTTVQAMLDFEDGAQVAMTLSWDGWPGEWPHIELHGDAGMLTLPDPDFFGGRITCQGRDVPTSAHPLAAINWPPGDSPTLANYRGIGLADMADAITSGRPHRASGELALHVLEILQAIDLSTNTGEKRMIISRCARPNPQPLTLPEVERLR